uniref:26S proteasome complex subunit SEM1 n=1 Tax=Schistosoma haematobium TaxID=6185 RepID=A0A094ZIJ2_SCHHA
MVLACSSEHLQDPEQVEEALGILKDDKEFEEFEKETWTASEEEISDLQVWDDKWDCEVEIDDQFTQYLRQELTKLGHLHETN